MKLRPFATLLLVLLFVQPVHSAPKKPRFWTKKFVTAVLLPSLAASALAAEGASCQHYGPERVIVRHPPCGRGTAYGLYFGLGLGNALLVGRLKQIEERDALDGYRTPTWQRWEIWTGVYPASVGGMGARNLARPRK